MVTEHRLSIQRACRATGLSRAAYYKVPPLPQEKDAEVIDALNGVVERNGRRGFWKCFDRLRLDGRPWHRPGSTCIRKARHWRASGRVES